MTYKIEKNVPIPSPKSKYPFAEMEVGDSFLVPSGNAQKIAGAANAFSKYRKLRGIDIKFATRTEKDGARVWRIL